MAQQQKTAAEVLNREFLEIRCRLIDIAAALDRIDRAPDHSQANADIRHGQIQAALRVISSDAPDRAEKVQLVFSDDYNSNWAEGFAASSSPRRSRPEA